MIRSLVTLSVRHRHIVVAIASILGIYGIVVSCQAKLNVFPDFAPPLVTVQTEAPGFSPEEVEALVTQPIENAVNGVGGLASIRSQSIPGLSVITTIFAPTTDVLRARQLVTERLAEAAGLMPQGVRPPTLTPLTSLTSAVLFVGLTSRVLSPMELRTFAEFTLRRRLLGVSGVAKVILYGGEVRQLQVEIDPGRLASLGVSVAELMEAARRATGVRGAGFIDTANQRLLLRTLGQSLTPQDLAHAVVAQRGSVPLRLGDVARVEAAAEPRIGAATVQGRDGVIVEISGQLDTNIKDVTRRVEAALDELAPILAQNHVKLDRSLFRPATFIDVAIGNVVHSLILGGILVAAVLFLFLYNLRTAFISITAIPLSLLTAIVVLDRCGFSLDTMTLGGLAIAIGEVVDDAIIDVENIFRRLRENRLRAAPLPADRVIEDASLEVRSSVVYATFIVTLVFLPVMTMRGIQGKLFAPLGLAYVLAVLASLAVALTVTPALSALLLPGAEGEAHEAPLVGPTKRYYRVLLSALSAHPRAVMAGSLAVCLAALGALPFFGASFLPEFREGHFVIHMAMTPGTSIDESVRLGRQVSAALLAQPYVRSVCQAVGRAEKGDDTWGTNYSELDVELKRVAGPEAELAQDNIRKVLAGFPGAYFAVKTFLTERIEESLSGVTAQVAIKIFGDDLDAIDSAARQVANIVGGVPGAADVQIESPGGLPTRSIRLDPARMQQYGLSSLDVLDTIEAAYEGKVVGQVYEGNRSFDVAVIMARPLRAEPRAVGGLPIDTPLGGLVPLREVATIEDGSGRSQVVHEGGRRVQTVTCNIRGRDEASFVAQVRSRINRSVSFPPGVYAVYAGAAQARAASQHEILAHSLLAGAGILVLLSLVFVNARNLILVLANIPFALVGGVLGVFATGGWMSLGSLVGFVTLFGISTRNSIMMLSHYQHLVAVEGEPWGPATVLRGASERLVPVLMTASVTALGLLPIAMGSGDPGREIEGPMAIVILAGLITSTVLNLLVLPIIASRYGRFEA